MADQPILSVCVTGVQIVGSVVLVKRFAEPENKSKTESEVKGENKKAL